MTTPVVTVPPDAPVGEIAQLLVRRRISAVPVVDAAGAPIGIVSEHDLLARTGASAAEVMTSALITVSEETDVEDVRHLLLERRIRRVPVMRAGRLVGIVSRADLVATLATEWVCQVCGEPVRSTEAPQGCPRCLGGRERFVLQEQPPGS